MTESAMPAFRVSVVIPTYRRRESVRRALEALARQSLAPGEFEVIISIDGSEDGTREMVAGFSAPYALRGIWQANQGRAGACNHGIRHARGEVIVILDDDMEASPGLIAGHLAAHEPGSRRAVVGAAPMLVNPSSPPLVQFYAAGFNWRQEQLARPGHVLRFREAYSGNFSIRRQTMLEVGAFDPDFRVYGHEDYELALRLQRAGVELVFSREALAFQHYEKTFDALARDGISRGKTAVLFAAKHPEIVDTLQLSKYRQGPRTWRLLRSLLLGLSCVAPATPEAVTALVLWLEVRRPASIRRYYSFALDYFYWLGARAALREQREARDSASSSSALAVPEVDAASNALELSAAPRRAR